MRLWVVIVQDEDAGALLAGLLDAGVEAYAVASAGGFRRTGNVTLLVPTRDEQAPILRALLLDFAHTRTEVRTAGLAEGIEQTLGELAPAPVTVTVAGAVVFGLRLARWETW